MKFYSTSVARVTRSGKRYSMFHAVTVPLAGFSLAPLLANAFEVEGDVDIDAFDGSEGKRDRETSGNNNDDDAPPTKRQAIQVIPTLNTHITSSTPGSDNTSSDSVPEDNEVSAANKKAAKAAKKKNRKRGHKKAKKQREFSTSGQKPRADDVKKYVPSTSTPLPTAVSFDTLPVASTGYEGAAKGSSTSRKGRRSLAKVLAMKKHKYYAWDGVTPVVFTHPVTNEICFAGVGQPGTAGYTRAHRDACNAIFEAGQKAHFTKDQTDHKRGKDFGALNVGILWGHGPTEPYNLRNGSRHDSMLEELLANEDVQHLAHFQSSAFNMFLPNMYEKYHGLRIDLERARPKLRWNFPQSVFSAAAFNFGPQTVTSPHRDCMNLPSGFCAITALGDFNPKLGGHLVIDELGIIIEFPPGSCVLLPSAVCTHWNTDIQPGETRLSFTQFTSGALFRYADNGYRTEGQLKAYSKQLYNDVMARKATRWEEDIKLWNTLDDIFIRAELKVTGTVEGRHYEEDHDSEDSGSDA
ncbi:hypothetical protein DFP72DRAFT_1059643 [Ephemerocybe angulata]|uniref:Uncharacterized protein n=1 Tax=Ephemerocybe angulata TaxID=980116 RepID=A0A8H6IGT4_9AGAR|nr:hypothetical protein DFP72DRAFT_1059643 [Tulosesus angulatus]